MAARLSPNPQNNKSRFKKNALRQYSKQSPVRALPVVLHLKKARYAISARTNHGVLSLVATQISRPLKHQLP
jgi:hypothetical protein